MIFTDRVQAGTMLAELIDQYLSQLPQKAEPLVVGLPRGGVPVALQVARRLRCPLEVVVAKKLAFPGQPEYAIGAVSSDGVIVLNPDIPHEGQWKNYIKQQSRRLLDETRSIEQQFYRQARLAPTSFKDRLVVIIDDGIATGMTAMAAVKTARQRGATRVIMAAPVMSKESYSQLSSYCDHVLAISVPDPFYAVGQHYVNFEQTSTSEVIAALRENASYLGQMHPMAQEAQARYSADENRV